MQEEFSRYQGYWWQPVTLGKIFVWYDMNKSVNVEIVFYVNAGFISS
jgi:hypothetical protein